MGEANDEGVTRIDGDALAAKRETSRKPVLYTLRGEDFTFPSEMPLGVVLASREMAARGRLSAVADALETAFGAEQWKRFVGVAPTGDDIYDLWAALLGAYAVTEGESSSSPASSAAGGEPSKPSSSGSTKSTPGSSGKKKPAAGERGD